MTVSINIAEAQEVFSAPLGNFTVNVPPGWEVEPTQNRSEDVQVRFLPESGNGSMNIEVVDDIANLTTSESGLMEIAERELTSGFGLSDTKVEQDVECETYTVQENEACSYIISTEQYTQGKDLVIIQIITLIDGIPYYFSYWNWRDDLDGQLSLFEDLVDSFRTT